MRGIDDFADSEKSGIIQRYARLLWPPIGRPLARARNLQRPSSIQVADLGLLPI